MSMSGPRSAVGRGGFTRSAGAAAGRGVLLIVFALAIGILLLARALDDGGSGVQAGSAGSTAEPATSTPTTPPTPAPTTPTTAPLPPAHDPAQVPVLVLNGRELQGVARANNEELLRLGYNGLPPGNTPAPVATSNVYYTDPAYQADALNVAAALQIPPDRVVPLGDTDLGVDVKAAKVVVVLGQDDLGLKPG
jgi:hypothetical protein